MNFLKSSRKKGRRKYAFRTTAAIAVVFITQILAGKTQNNTALQSFVCLYVHPAWGAFLWLLIGASAQSGGVGHRNGHFVQLRGAYAGIVPAKKL